MTPEEYAATQAAISYSVAAFVERIASLFTGPVLSPADWYQLLQVVYPEVQRRYTESAELGRRFYDSQRQLHHPELPRNERFLSELPYRQFVQNMEPARRQMSQADSGRVAVAQFALRAVREVEMAGRRQIIGAVKNDTEKRIVQGWARVATGRETCAWCLMLISRGPTYSGADTAGLDLDNDSARSAFERAGGDLAAFYAETEEYIEQWHAGCDCKVVPVFDREQWFGKAEADRALKLWGEADREAVQRMESGEARSNNRNTEALNALRRRLERGDLSMTEFAALAA